MTRGGQNLAYQIGLCAVIVKYGNSHGSVSKAGVNWLTTIYQLMLIAGIFSFYFNNRSHWKLTFLPLADGRRWHTGIDAPLTKLQPGSFYKMLLRVAIKPFFKVIFWRGKNQAGFDLHAGFDDGFVVLLPKFSARVENWVDEGGRAGCCQSGISQIAQIFSHAIDQNFL